MSKKVKCPSCDMAGDPEGDDYSLVTTYHGRPVLQCFWCDSHVMLRRMGAPIVLDLNHKAIRHLRSDLDRDEMVAFLLDEEDPVVAQEAPAARLEAPRNQQMAAAVELDDKPAVTFEFDVEPAATSEFDDRLAACVEVMPEPVVPKRRKSRKAAPKPAMQLGEFEPAMLAEAPVTDNTPALLKPSEDYHNTPVGTQTELVSHIPLNARALDHESLIHIAAQVGWTYTPVRSKKYQPEWMNIELPPPPVLSPLRTKLQGTINMIKYFRINAGTKEQRRAETLARRQRLVDYRRRLFNDRLEVLNAMQAIEYKPKAI